ncbi:unannotated protein [freshwater metagenome]|uniref:Unannotated protein n=1 Tax=freshwater metagenome TaxID=449393 RepID=A0A6J7FXX4_9ZZZZ|nr:hypothetical protein [Actinomycetota bacterium]
MADNIQIRDAAGGTRQVATDEVTPGVHVQRTKTTFGVDGGATDVSTASPLPTADTPVKTAVDAVKTAVDTLRAQVSTPLTNTELRAAAVPVDTEFGPAAVPTDTDANNAQPTVDARQSVFNGTTWERRRGVQEAQLLAAAVRSATVVSPTVTNVNGRTLRLSLWITANAQSATMLFQFRTIPLGLGGAPHLTQFSIAAGLTGFFHIDIGPGLTQNLGGAQNNIVSSQGTAASINTTLGRTFAVALVAQGAGDFNASVVYSLGV